ncbi:MAG TPA: hypothetical protein GXX75_02740 [Clostridiales bacterium]|nr:hypothetical protein [Clostridiales bacterium]
MKSRTKNKLTKEEVKGLVIESFGDVGFVEIEEMKEHFGVIPWPILRQLL